MITGTCTFCHELITAGAEEARPAGAVPLIGDRNPMPDWMALTDALARHHMLHHPPAIQGLMEMALNYQRACIAKTLVTTDPRFSEAQQHAVDLAYWTLRGRFDYPASLQTIPAKVQY